MSLNPIYSTPTYSTLKPPSSRQSTILDMASTLYFGVWENTAANMRIQRHSSVSGHTKLCYQIAPTCWQIAGSSFWDWSLDWEDPTKSPIFDTKLGFGGDGNPDGPTYQGSHCVDSTPFKNINPKWWEDRYEPHCLIRNFEEDWFGHYVNPEAIAKVMNTTTYADFFLKLEMGPHDIAPMGIRGDMSLFTAPNGELAAYFLAHVSGHIFHSPLKVTFGNSKSPNGVNVIMAHG